MAERMPKRGLCLRLGMFRTVACLSAFLGAVLPGFVLCGADFSPANAASSSPFAVPLAYQETDYNVAVWSMSPALQTARFVREPPAASGKTIRGVLNFGGAATNSISFLWQRDARKLFLDLNRNGDLTDDSNGVFSAQTANPVSYQTFTNVHLSFNTASGRSRVRVDLLLYDENPQPFCEVMVRSYWQGKATLNGRDWQAGIVPINLNPLGSFENSQMLLRPWEVRGQPFTVSSSSLATIPFSRNLFLDGHAYQVNLAFESQAGEVKPFIQLTGQTAVLGEMRITGKFIQRLVLSGPCLVCLDQPAGVVKIPVGGYRVSSILLKQGNSEAYQDNSGPASSGWVLVESNAPSVLNTGGPLTNSVVAAREGQDLSLDYRLIGAGGATYRMVNPKSSKPPVFAIYKGDREIASDNFQFG